MSEKKFFDGAEIRGTVLYCPECGSRIAIRTDVSNRAMETFIVLRGKCKCPSPLNTEWSFTYRLNIE